MSDHAYLYSCNSEQDDNALILVKTCIGGEEPYGNASWSIPFAWLFFFRVENLRIGSGSAGLRFSAIKDAACDLLQTRESLIQNCFPDKPEVTELLNTLLREVRSWRGKYLHLDPSEIYENDPEVIREQVTHFMQAIETQDPQLILELARTCEAYIVGIKEEYFKVSLMGALYHSVQGTDDITSPAQ